MKLNTVLAARLQHTFCLGKSTHDVELALVQLERDVVLGQLFLHLQHVFYAVVGNSNHLAETLVHALRQPLCNLLYAPGVDVSMDHVDVNKV